MNRSQILDFLLVHVGIVVTIFPTSERIAGLDKSVLGQLLRHIVTEGLVVHLTARRTVAIKLHGVTVGRPLGVEGNLITVHCGQVLDFLPIFIGNRTVFRGAPTSECIASLDKSVWRQVLRCIIAEGLVVHLTACCTVVIEFHGVGVGNIPCIQRHAIRDAGVRRHLSAALSSGKPAEESVAVAVQRREGAKGFAVFNVSFIRIINALCIGVETHRAGLGPVIWVVYSSVCEI